MWKRTDQPDPPGSSAAPAAKPAAPRPTPPAAPVVTAEPRAARLGHSVVIKGDLSGAEDLTIEGRVEGKIESREHAIIIGERATVKAQIFAKHVVVLGRVVGDITASTKIEIREPGSVEGDVVSPTVAIAEGATFRGSIDMSRESAA